MNKIFKKEIFRSITYIFSGTVIGSMIGAINTILVVQNLGLERNGIIFLGLSYVSFFNALFNFQSYEAIIKYLPGNMEKNNEKGKNYILLGYYFDVITAILAFLVSFFCVKYAGKYLKWSQEIYTSVKISCFTILFTLTGTCIGVLRIFKEFKTIAIINILKNVILFFFYVYGFYFKKEIYYYIVVNLIAVILQTSYMYLKTYKILYKKQLLPTKLKASYDKEFVTFAIFSNFNTVLDLPIFHLTTFIINKYVGVSEIAVYKILENLGSVLKRITGIISQVIMPEISIAIAEKKEKEMYKLVYRSGILFLALGVVSFVFVVFTKQYWLGYFIPNYLEYVKVIYLYLGYVILTTVFIFQHPIFIYSGYVKWNSIILIIANCIYVILVLNLVKSLGIVGIVNSLIIQAIIVFSLKGIILHKFKGEK